MTVEFVAKTIHIDDSGKTTLEPNT